MKVLVAYATKHGATRGIAERIAQTLTGDGLDVTLSPAVEATAEGFDAYVIGAAAYMTHWLGDATEFVRDNQKLLAAKPVWLFSSGPIGTDLVDKQGRDVLEVSRPKEFDDLATLVAPRDEHVFFGAYDPDAPAIGLAERIGGWFTRSDAVRAALPAGDFRDWPKIEAWAHQIAAELRQPVPANA